MSGKVVTVTPTEVRLDRLEAQMARLCGDKTVRTKSVEDITAELDGSGSDGDGAAEVIRDPSFNERYKDRSCVIVCPTRGQIPVEVDLAWRSLAMPMNQKHNWMFAKGYEVAAAYNALILGILDHAFLKTWKWVLTVEDDNIPPFDGVLRLIETAEAGPKGDGTSEWDAVGGLYFTKDAVHSPMAYGDADEFEKTGYAHYYPVDLAKVKPCVKYPCDTPDCMNHVIPCNGVAMGFTIWKMDLFRKMVAAGHKKLFVTVNDKILVDGELISPIDADGMVELEPGKGYKKLCTQDLAFCDLALTRFGARFCVDARVRVGHMDTATGRIY